jgi:hypothetical protein
LTPETGLFLAKARRLLVEAEGMLTTIHYNEAAEPENTPVLPPKFAALCSELRGRTLKTRG